MSDTPAGTVNSIFRIFGVVLVLVTLIIGVYSMVQPMSNTVDNMRQEIRELKAQIVDHAAEHAHSGAASDINALQTETENRFTDLEGDIDHVGDVMNLKNQEYERLIIVLWNTLFPGSSLPASDYHPLGNTEGGS